MPRAGRAKRAALLKLQQDRGLPRAPRSPLMPRGGSRREVL